MFVFLSPGRTGLMPVAETGVDRGGDMAKAFPIGSDVEVVVLEVDPASRRIRLSRKAVAQQREQAELREYVARSEAAPDAVAGVARREPAERPQASLIRHLLLFSAEGVTGHLRMPVREHAGRILFPGPDVQGVEAR